MNTDSREKRYTARIEPDGEPFEAPADSTLLQSAERHGLQLPSSCRNGTCRTCLCRLTAGRVLYRIEWPGLSAEEKADGCILPCVAYPQSDVRIKLQVTWPYPTLQRLQ